MWWARQRVLPESWETGRLDGWQDRNSIATVTTNNPSDGSHAVEMNPSASNSESITREVQGLYPGGPEVRLDCATTSPGDAIFQMNYLQTPDASSQLSARYRRDDSQGDNFIDIRDYTGDSGNLVERVNVSMNANSGQYISLGVQVTEGGNHTLTLYNPDGSVHATVGGSAPLSSGRHLLLYYRNPDSGGTGYVDNLRPM